MIKILLACFGGTIISAFFVIQPGDQASWLQHQEAGEKAASYGNDVLARSQFESALKLARLATAPPDQLVTSLHSIGKLEARNHRPEEAAAHFRETLNLLTSQWGKEDPMVDIVRRDLAKCHAPGVSDGGSIPVTTSFENRSGTW